MNRMQGLEPRGGGGCGGGGGGVGGGGGGGVGLAHAAVQEDSLLQFPAGVGKQLCPTVSHMNLTCGAGGGEGGGGAGHVKQDSLDALELAPQSNRPVDQPLTGKLSGLGWFGNRFPVEAFRQSS